MLGKSCAQRPAEHHGTLAGWFKGTETASARGPAAREPLSTLSVMSTGHAVRAALDLVLLTGHARAKGPEQGHTHSRPSMNAGPPTNQVSDPGQSRQHRPSNRSSSAPG